MYAPVGIPVQIEVSDIPTNRKFRIASDVKMVTYTRHFHVCTRACTSCTTPREELKPTEGSPCEQPHDLGLHPLFQIKLDDIIAMRK